MSGAAPVDPPPAGAALPILPERRERIAAAVLGGFAAKYGTEGRPTLGNDYSLSPVAAALAWADALIAELDKPRDLPGPGHCCEDWTYRGVPCPCDGMRR